MEAPPPPLSMQHVGSSGERCKNSVKRPQNSLHKKDVESNSACEAYTELNRVKEIDTSKVHRLATEDEMDADRIHQKPRGRPSGLTNHKWDEMYEVLRKFRLEHGHTIVPVGSRTRGKLGTW